MKYSLLAAFGLKGVTTAELKVRIYPENTLQQDNKPTISQSKLK